MAEPIILTDAQQTPNMNGLPMWAKVVFQWGVPSAIALYLVYNLTSLVPPGMTQLHRMMDAHAQEFAVHAEESDASTTSILRVLQGICLNAANNKEEQRRCLD